MTEPIWRTGRTVGRTIYYHGKLAGLMDTPELAGMLVDAANRDLERTVEIIRARQDRRNLMADLATRMHGCESLAREVPDWLPGELDRVAAEVTRDFLHPALRAAGVQDPERYRVAYETKPILPERVNDDRGQ